MKIKNVIISFLVSLFIFFGPSNANAQNNKGDEINENDLKSIINSWLTEHDHVCLRSISLAGETAIHERIIAEQKKGEHFEYNPQLKDQAIYKGNKPGVLAALEVEGLVVPEKVDNETIYKFTKKGENSTFNRQLCYGKRTVDKVVKWRGPEQEGAFNIVYAYFVPSLELKNWAKNSLVQEKFPEIKEAINTMNVNKANNVYSVATLAESNIGWDVVRLQFF